MVRKVESTTPGGPKTLIIWRKLTGDPEQDNLVLNIWMKDKLKSTPEISNSTSSK
jgi:adenine-specific DNA-methyltransferase